MPRDELTDSRSLGAPRPANKAGRSRMPARERLLAAADELFYSEGVQSVGIDRVIERAGVAKASLYSAFGSKEALVRAYLDGRHSAIAERLRSAIDRAESPREAILAVFDAQADRFSESDFRGCAFVAASSEATPGGQIEQAVGEYRAHIRRVFLQLVRNAEARDPETLATQLQIIYDGTALAARSNGDPPLRGITRQAVETLLNSEVRAGGPGIG